MGLHEIKNAESKVNIKPKRKKLNREESRIGYMMVAPALIIIAAIALYPVIKSFWYSLYDIRLNNPTKNQVYSKYELNMENYFGNESLAEYTLGQAIDDAKGEDKENLQADLNKLKDIDAGIQKEKNVASKAEQVKAYTDKFQPVKDNNLKYVAIDKNVAQSSHSALVDIRNNISKINDDKKIAVNVQKAGGLIEELRDSVIMPNFVGLDNYKYYLDTNNKDFWRALGYTFEFTIISVFLELVLGIIIALIINKPFKGRGIVRAAVLVPWAIPTVVCAMMWQFLYNGQYGLMAHIFTSLHLIKNSGVLLTTHSGSTFAIIFSDVWKTSPYMALLILAGLLGIDKSLYEAAAVDGASKVRQFFSITLPLLKPTILVALLFRSLDAFRIFDLVYVLTGGANETETISTLAYKTMFSQLEFGKGSTLAVFVFICVAILSILYIKVLGADVMSEGK